MRPPFELATVTLFSEPDRLVRLADRYDDVAPAARPGRYEGASLWLTRLAPSAASFELHWPATCCARTIDLTPGGPVAELLELSPLPFAHRLFLEGLEGGAPTFYLAYTDHPYPPDGEALRTGDAALALTGAWLGILFQDRLATAPWAWFDRLAAAPGAVPAWQDWANAFAGRRSLRLLDHVGRPLAGQAVTVEAGGDVHDLVSDSAGDLGPVAPGSRLTFPAGLALPLAALTDAAESNVAGEASFQLPPGVGAGHVQVLDLAEWFAPQLDPDPESPAIGARFRRNSRMEPLVDGEETFARLMADLDAVRGSAAAAYFAGWAFKDFPLRIGDEDSRLDRIAAAINGSGGETKVLAAQFVQADEAELDELSREIALAMMALFWIANAPAAGTRGAGVTGAIGIALWVLAEAAAIANLAKGLLDGERIGKLIKDHVEQTSPEFLEKLAAQCRALYAPHPSTMDDNPLAGDITLPDGRHLSELQNRWGIYHQKIQAIVKPDGEDRFAAYVGGIDINTNRHDSPGHNGAVWVEPDSPEDPHASPFHDVHCRLTGPAASEVFHVLKWRNEQVGPVDAKPVIVPGPGDWGEPGRHVIQVAQTVYRPSTPPAGVPTWVRDGNAATHATFVNAIKAAREHIYIEEQYMVPSTPYMEALKAAAGHCRRLVILLPSFLEVYFGDRKRGQFFDELAAAWGDRLYIGTPLRRPVLASPGRVTSRGRLTLMTEIPDGTSTRIVVGPATRVPEGRFFLWIEGELMFAVAGALVVGPDGQPAKELEVLRGGMGPEGIWCPDPRPHGAGAAVTAAQPTPIFLHSKIMMVDDVFVAIGSTNINRRGFFHDGEITAFAIPDQLRGAADNPALSLRTRLWGEQLGLAPAMGAALFRDPIAGFELFKRSRYAGNRVVPLSELKLPEPTLAELPSMVEQVLPDWASNLIQFSLQNWIEVLGPTIFDSISDPTTTLETGP
ncbi:phospholipase D-like domain-containing protein [Phenylobacterium sp.]|uniref:phospholipase D-like domain-containing protein n=1 Tax=Phenylobacterium sp. TaxID=1871053 RepID=UPI002EDB0C97